MSLQTNPESNPNLTGIQFNNNSPATNLFDTLKNSVGIIAEDVAKGLLTGVKEFPSRVVSGAKVAVENPMKFIGASLLYGVPLVNAVITLEKYVYGGAGFSNQIANDIQCRNLLDSALKDSFESVQNLESTDGLNAAVSRCGYSGHQIIETTSDGRSVVGIESFGDQSEFSNVLQIIIYTGKALKDLYSGLGVGGYPLGATPDDAVMFQVRVQGER